MILYVDFRSLLIDEMTDTSACLSCSDVGARAKRIEWLPEDEASSSVIEAYLARQYARPAFQTTLKQTDTVPPPRPTVTPSA